MRVVKSWVMEKLDDLQSKYHFREEFALEQEDVYDFCTGLLDAAYNYGLNLEEDDFKFSNDLVDAFNDRKE